MTEGVVDFLGLFVFALLYAGFPGLIIGIVFALIPWLVLRRRLKRAGRLIWTSAGAWVLAFVLPFVILLARGGGAAYGGAGIGVVYGGPTAIFKIAAVLAPPIGALLAGLLHWAILRRQVSGPAGIAAITALGWPLAYYGGLATRLLLGPLPPLEKQLAFAADVALVLTLSRWLIGRLVRTAPSAAS